MCALPLPEVLCDFEDSIKNIRPDPCKNDNIVKEISLVADSLRLGGAILKFYPGHKYPIYNYRNVTGDLSF